MKIDNPRALELYTGLKRFVTDIQANLDETEKTLKIIGKNFQIELYLDAKVYSISFITTLVAAKKNFGWGIDNDLYKLDDFNYGYISDAGLRLLKALKTNDIYWTHDHKGRLVVVMPSEESDKAYMRKRYKFGWIKTVSSMYYETLSEALEGYKV